MEIYVWKIMLFFAIFEWVKVLWVEQTKLDKSLLLFGCLLLLSLLMFYEQTCTIKSGEMREQAQFYDSFCKRLAELFSGWMLIKFKMLILIIGLGVRKM